MTFDERIGWFLLGCLIGFILGYMTRHLKKIEEKVEHMEEQIGHIPPRNEAGLARRPLLLDVVLGVVVLLTLWSLWEASKNDKALEDNYKSDEVARCQAGVENREVQRDLVDAVYTLATGIVDPNQNYTPQELIRINSYIDRANEFRRDTYEKIKPSDHCKRFVSDDNVKPKSPPYPRLNMKEAVDGRP